MEMYKFQNKVQEFLTDCFGKEILENKPERNYRFFEEATELVQSCGMSKEDCYKLVDYVYGRPIGDIEQEIGGVMITLFGLACAHNFSMDYCAGSELKNCYERIDKIRAKWEAKTIKSDPLPINLNTNGGQVNQTL